MRRDEKSKAFFTVKVQIFTSRAGMPVSDIFLYFYKKLFSVHSSYLCNKIILAFVKKRDKIKILFVPQKLTKF